jgi:hypothetical protein
VHGPGAAKLAAAVLVPLVAKRLAGNHRPVAWDVRTVVNRLVLDRDPPPPSGRAGMRRLAA